MENQNSNFQLNTQPGSVISQKPPEQKSKKLARILVILSVFLIAGISSYFIWVKQDKIITEPNIITPTPENHPDYLNNDLENIEKPLFYYDILKDNSEKAYIYNFYLASLNDFSINKIYSNKVYAGNEFNNPGEQEYAKRVFEVSSFPQNDYDKRVKRYGKDKIITDLFNKEFEFDVIGIDGKKEVKNYPINKSSFKDTIFSDDVSLIASPTDNGVAILDKNGQLLKNIEIDFSAFPDRSFPRFFSTDDKFIYGESSGDTGTDKCMGILWKIDLKSANVIKEPSVRGCGGSGFKNNSSGIIILEHNTKDTGTMSPEEVEPSKVFMVNLELFTKKELFVSEKSYVFDALLSPNNENVLYVTSEGIFIFNIADKTHENVSNVGGPLFKWVDNENFIYYKTGATGANSSDEYHLVNTKIKEDKILSFLKFDSVPVPPELNIEEHRKFMRERL